MPYSLDFRQKVINFVENGGTITKAAHTFGIGRASIYRWLSRPKLSATKVKSSQRKLDWKELEKDVKQNPDSRVFRQVTSGQASIKIYTKISPY